jgi:hypothetical protein
MTVINMVLSVKNLGTKVQRSNLRLISAIIKRLKVGSSSNQPLNFSSLIQNSKIHNLTRQYSKYLNRIHPKLILYLIQKFSKYNNFPFSKLCKFRTLKSQINYYRRFRLIRTLKSTKFLLSSYKD